jgi:hypothetical protein
LFRFWPGETKPGNNTVIFKLNKKDILSYKESICIEVGDEQSISISKNLLDSIAKITVE